MLAELRPSISRAAHAGESAAPGTLDAVLTSFDALYQWSYAADLHSGLRELYEKGVREQWNGALDRDWSIAVDPESEIIPAAVNPLRGYPAFDRLDAREQARVRHAQISLHLSQFLHGEQGAMIVASQLVGAVPWIDAKLYASSQTMDEARHVEVFSRYVREKLEWEWPIDPPLKELLDVAIRDPRWDFKYMAMQVLIEGLAMAAFANLHELTREPLLRELLRYVMRDEARHVAFGVLSLRDFYAELPARELAEREEFIVYAAELLRRRLFAGQIAGALGWDVEDVRAHVLRSASAQGFQALLFSRVVPNLKRLGLLTPRVREAFAGLGILHFEHCDPDEQDRRLTAD